MINLRSWITKPFRSSVKKVSLGLMLKAIKALGLILSDLFLPQALLKCVKL